MGENILEVGTRENSTEREYFTVRMDRKEKESGKMAKEKDGLFLMMITRNCKIQKINLTEIKQIVKLNIHIIIAIIIINIMEVSVKVINKTTIVIVKYLKMLLSNNKNMNNN